MHDHDHQTIEQNNASLKQGLVAAGLIGVIIGNFIFHILPEAAESFTLPFSPVWVFFGISLQWLLHQPLKVAKSAGTQFLIFLMIHNISDGLVVGFASVLGTLSAISALLSILGHDIVHKIIGYTLLRQDGLSKKTATLSILIPTISLISGFFLGHWFGISESSPALASFTAGSLFYVTTVIAIELKGVRELYGKKTSYYGVLLGILFSLFFIFTTQHFLE